jgi:hypothetical protein
MTKLSPSTTRAIPVIVVGAAELFSPAAWAGLTPKATECPNYLWMSENGSLAERESVSFHCKGLKRINNFYHPYSLPTVVPTTWAALLFD